MTAGAVAMNFDVFRNTATCLPIMAYTRFMVFRRLSRTGEAWHAAATFP